MIFFSELNFKVYDLSARNQKRSNLVVAAMSSEEADDWYYHYYYHYHLSTQSFGKGIIIVCYIFVVI